MKTKFVVFAALAPVLLCCSTPSHAETQPSAGMMRYPDVSQDRIVFVYADDLWTVDRAGGVATPLASPAGPERNPRFSPDGKTIAFMGNYEGTQDIYTIPTAGGTAQRITYHPAYQSLNDWHPNGKALVYATNGHSGLARVPQLFTYTLGDPLPKKLPVPYGNNGAISPDGQWLAYTPNSRDTRTWKRYRGGMASDIWLFHLENKTAKQITDFSGTDSLPMWHGSTIYYLSDAGTENRLNIWAYETPSGERRQVTKFEDDDCKWPSIGPGPEGQGEIILQNGSGLYLIDLETGKAEQVQVTIPGDRPKLRRQQIDASEFIETHNVSPQGKRLALEARGDIWTVPVENGPKRNLTRTNGVAERFPDWSPDGRWIAYFSDATGEYELYLTQSDGKGKTKQLTDGGNTFRYYPIWSPDSQHILFTDKAGGIHLYSLESEETKTIDTDPYAEMADVSWSYNSQWLAYSKNSDQKGPTASIWIYNVADGSKRQATSGYFNDASPAFDRKGEFLYFSSNRAFNRPQYEDMGTTFIYDDTEILMAMPLRSDVDHPFQPESDEESWEDEDGADEDGSSDGEEDPAKQDDNEEENNGDQDDNDDAGDDKKEKENNADQNDDADADSEEDDSDDDEKEDEEKDDEDANKPFEIEFDGLERRALRLPVGQGSFGSLEVNKKNQLVYSEFGAAAGSEGNGSSIKLFDVTDDEREAKIIVKGAGSFELTAEGDQLLVVDGDKAYVVKAEPEQSLDEPVPTDGMYVMIDPREEWRQLFADAWRIERDFFYDPNMHGVDWKAVRDHYEAMLDDCVSRRDVGFVISEMISEINVGHAYYREGDVESGPRGNVGLLGCRFELDDGAYKIAEIYEGAVWDVDARNPLRSAGVKEGEYLLAVNGLPLSTDENPYAMFANLAGSVVTLTISKNSKSGDDDDREISVKPVGSDRNLRFRGAIERNRKYVEEKTNGQVGYIYVVNTSIPGQNDLVRQYYAQLGKKALIIDERWNGGGQIPTRFIELLNRPVTNYWAVRDGRDWTWPPDAHHGPKCMLINGMAGSGGDMFPALFRQASLGKLIGTRTWGGLVGISGNPGLIDGGSVTAPTFAFYETDGTWGIEGHGVDPDIKVIDDPEKMVEGGDPQLDAAIEHMLAELKTKAYQKPNRPTYPDRSKAGIAPSDK